MMANRILSAFRGSNYCLLQTLPKRNNYVAVICAPQGKFYALSYIVYIFTLNIKVFILFIVGVKQLYSRAALGVEGFELQQEHTRRQMSNISEKFKEKMMEYSQNNDAKTMIFTEDLKNMIHLAKNDDELATVIRMIKR